MTGFEASGGWPWQEGLRCFVILFALSTHCKYDFIHFTCCQWTSTWMVRICHIALTDVPSKTEHRILYVYVYSLLSRLILLDLLLCTLPGRRPVIAEGNERTRLGRVHLYFFRFLKNYSFVGY